jgi:hypothetical protein
MHRGETDECSRHFTSPTPSAFPFVSMPNGEELYANLFSFGDDG